MLAPSAGGLHGARSLEDLSLSGLEGAFHGLDAAPAQATRVALVTPDVIWILRDDPDGVGADAGQGRRLMSRKISLAGDDHPRGVTGKAIG